MVGYFNTDLTAPEGQEMEKGIAEALEWEGLKYMSDYFLPHHKPWLKDGCTWAMPQGCWEVRSWTDYILGTESCLFQNVVVWYV